MSQPHFDVASLVLKKDDYSKSFVFGEVGEAKIAGKSEEEIALLSVDESLKDIERAAHLLGNGTALQKTSVLKSLPLLLSENSRDDTAASTLLPIVCRVIVPSAVTVGTAGRGVSTPQAAGAGPELAAMKEAQSVAAVAFMYILRRTHQVVSDQDAAAAPDMNCFTEDLSGMLERIRGKGKQEHHQRRSSPVSIQQAQRRRLSSVVHPSSPSKSVSSPPLCVSDQLLIQHLLPLAQKMTTVTSHDEGVAKRWSQVLAALTERYTKQLEGKVTTFVMEQSVHTHPPALRAICCALLGALSACVDAHTIEDGFLNKAMSMCQDTSRVVRAAMAKQLSAVAVRVQPKTAERVVYPELEELLRDEELDVRTSALHSLVDILHILPPQNRSKAVTFLLQAYSDYHDDLVPTLAQVLGRVVVKLSAPVASESPTVALSSVDSQALMTFQRFFERLSDPFSSAAELRQQASYNFPALVFCWCGAADDWLLSMLKRLLSDTDTVVRSRTAGYIHELVSVFHSRGQRRDLKSFEAILMKLLADCPNAVALNLLSHLQSVVDVLMEAHGSSSGSGASSGVPSSPRASAMSAGSPRSVGGVAATKPGVVAVDRRHGLVVALLKVMLALHHKAKYAWRLSVAALDSIVYLLPNLRLDDSGKEVLDQVLETVVGIVMVGSEPEQVRLSACRVLAFVMAGHPSVTVKTDLTKRLVSELSHHQSSAMRLTFIDVCVELLGVFSRKWFNYHIFEVCLHLTKDSVRTVRQRMCRLLPSLKGVLVLPADASRLDTLNRIVAKLQTDKDSLVAETARKAVDEMSLMSTRTVESKDANSSSFVGKMLDPQDEEDKRRERFERDIFVTDAAKRKQQAGAPAPLFGNPREGSFSGADATAAAHASSYATGWPYGSGPSASSAATESTLTAITLSDLKSSGSLASRTDAILNRLSRVSSSSGSKSRALADIRKGGSRSKLAPSAASGKAPARRLQPSSSTGLPPRRTSAATPPTETRRGSRGRTGIGNLIMGSPRSESGPSSAGGSRGISAGSGTSTPFSKSKLVMHRVGKAVVGAPAATGAHNLRGVLNTNQKTKKVGRK